MRGRLETIVQIATLVSVVAGLGIVIWELRQTRELTRAELTADAMSQVNAQNLVVAGEEPAASIARACETPEILTSSDIIVLSAYYTTLLDRLRRLHLIERRSDRDIAGDEWKVFADGNFIRIFSTDFGRWWWKTLAMAEPEIRQYGDALLVRQGDPQCKSVLESYRAYIKSIESPI